MGSHRYVRGVIFPRREVTGMLHGAVARGSDLRGGSVHKGAALRQEMRRSSEIPSFHAEKVIPNPQRSGKIKHNPYNNPFLLIYVLHSVDPRLPPTTQPHIIFSVKAEKREKFSLENKRNVRVIFTMQK